MNKNKDIVKEVSGDEMRAMLDIKMAENMLKKVVINKDDDKDVIKSKNEVKNNLEASIKMNEEFLEKYRNERLGDKNDKD